MLSPFICSEKKKTKQDKTIANPVQAVSWNTIIIMTRKLQVSSDPWRLPWLPLHPCFVSLHLQVFYIRFFRGFLFSLPWCYLPLTYRHRNDTPRPNLCDYFHFKYIITHKFRDQVIRMHCKDKNMKILWKIITPCFSNWVKIQKFVKTNKNSFYNQTVVLSYQMEYGSSS